MENNRGLSPRVFGKRAQSDLGKALGLQRACDRSIQLCYRMRHGGTFWCLKVSSLHKKQNNILGGFWSQMPCIQILFSCLLVK